MAELIDQLLVISLLANFVVLGSSRLPIAIRAVAVQGVILGCLPSILHPFSWHLAAITAGMIIAKGIVIPSLLRGAMLQIEIRKEQDPYLGYVTVLTLGGITTAAAFVFGKQLPLAPEHRDLLFVPAAISTLATGFLILTTRRKALSQVIGYLIMENGIFLFGLLLTTAMPVMVEAGALLDLLVGIFVMGIIINHISREFSSIDTGRLTALKE